MFQKEIVSLFKGNWKYLVLFSLPLILVSAFSLNDSGFGFSGIVIALLGIPLELLHLHIIKNNGVQKGSGKNIFETIVTADMSTVLKYIGAYALKLLAIILGLIFLIIPGLYIAYKLIYTNLFVLEEKLGPVEAMKASWKATKVASPIKPILQLFAINFVFGFAIGFIVTLFVLLSPGATEDPNGSYIVASDLSTLYAGILYIPVGLVINNLYGLKLTQLFFKAKQVKDLNATV